VRAVGRMLGRLVTDQQQLTMMLPGKGHSGRPPRRSQDPLKYESTSTAGIEHAQPSNPNNRMHNRPEVRQPLLAPGVHAALGRAPTPSPSR
jgi:hypothetical protein